MRTGLRAGLLAAGFGLAGCQTLTPPDPTSPDAPATDEMTSLSTNELNRFGRRDLAAGYSGKAERYFRAAIERNENDLSSWIGLAAAYDNLRRFDLADRAYEQVIRIGGETATVVNNRGYSYLLRGDRARALALFEKARRLEPDNPVPVNNIRLLRSGELPSAATSR